MLSVVGESYNLENSAGKTGTAQSGIYEGGKEILRTWFAGYFPANNPEYIVVILNEDGSSGTTDCVPVFKAIADGIRR
jgi:cell division protein FtsI/penicillin-binding protein 2